MRDLCLALVFLGCAAYWTLGGVFSAASTPRLDRSVVSSLAPTPIVSQVMPVGDHESVVLMREGAVLRIYVLYDGVVRGQLVRIDTSTRTLEAPSRPPAGWSIGGL